MNDNRIEKVISELKRMSEKDSYKLTLLPEKNVSVYSSRLGGAPYIPKGDKYPKDSSGNAMLFLCGINLEDIGKTGLLQFFISAAGSCEGKVVYNKSLEKPNEKKYNKASYPTMPCDGYSPVKQECAISLEAVKDYISVSDVHFPSMLKTAVKNVLGEDMDGYMYSFFDEEECKTLCRELTGTGHKLLGYPFFAQEDYRDEDTEEILLLQLDSEYDSERTLTMWGDSGAGNFFITQAELESLDFSGVTFNWDCY